MFKACCDAFAGDVSTPTPLQFSDSLSNSEGSAYRPRTHAEALPDGWLGQQLSVKSLLTLAPRSILEAQGAELSPSHSLAHYATQSLPSCTICALSKKIHFRIGGGPGAGSLLSYQREAACAIEDVMWSTALRARIGLSRLECIQAELNTASTTCLCPASGSTYGRPLGDRGFHADTCSKGGGVVTRHGRIIEAVICFFLMWTKHRPLFEQRVFACDCI